MGSCILFALQELTVVAMLTAYFDESGTDERSPAVAMGGYVSTGELWNEFQLEWEAMLSKHRIKEFHTTDLMAFQGEFKRSDGWDESRQAALLDDARSIIKSRTIFGLVAAVIIADCEMFFPLQDEKKRRRKFAKEYELCAYGCMVGIGRWAAEHGDDRLMEYIFERGAKGRHQVEKTLGKVKKDHEDRQKYRLLDWDFKDKRTRKNPLGLVQLHPADMLVHQTCRVISDSPAGLQFNKIEKSLSQLIRSQDRKLYYLDRTNFPKLVSLWQDD